MPLHSDLTALLSDPPPPPSVTPEILPAVRAHMLNVGKALPQPSGIDRQDLMAGDVPLRLYRPVNGESGALLVFLHGGGWILGDLETHDAMCAWIAEVAGCATLAVRYRLAPEHRFPAGLDDCDAAYRWAIDNAAALGCDPLRVALGGESAGANLAAAVTLRRAARGERQPPFQCLIHPLTDFRFETRSIRELEAPGLSIDYGIAVRDLYLGPTQDRDDPEASPARAESLAGLAPAIVITAECDPLRDDGEAYALALAAAGVETLIQRLPGLPHGFLFLPADIPVIAQAFRLIGRLLRRYSAAP